MKPNIIQSNISKYTTIRTWKETISLRSHGFVPNDHLQCLLLPSTSFRSSNPQGYINTYKWFPGTQKHVRGTQNCLLDTKYARQDCFVGGNTLRLILTPCGIMWHLLLTVILVLYLIFVHAHVWVITFHSCITYPYHNLHDGLSNHYERPSDGSLRPFASYKYWVINVKCKIWYTFLLNH